MVKDNQILQILSENDLQEYEQVSLIKKGLEKGKLSEKEVIQTLIEYDYYNLLSLLSVVIINKSSIYIIINYLINNKYYSSFCLFYNTLKANIPIKYIYNIIIETRNMDVICYFIYHIQNETLKNRLINYIIEQKDSKYIIYLIENLLNAPYKKLFDALLSIPNTAEYIYFLATEGEKYSIFAIDALIASNNEKLIRDFYERFSEYISDNLEIKEKLKKKIKDIEDKYSPRKLETLSEVIDIKFKESLLLQFTNLFFHDYRGFFDKLEQYFLDLQKLNNSTLSDVEYLRIINKYYDINITDIERLSSLFLGSTKIKKESNKMNEHYTFIPEIVLKYGKPTIFYEKKYEHRYRSRIMVDPYVDKTIVFKPHHELVSKIEEKYIENPYYKIDQYFAVVTYYCLDGFDCKVFFEKSYGLKVEQLEELIKERKIIVTEVNMGNYFGTFSEKEISEGIKEMSKSIESLPLNATNGFKNYAEFMTALFKTYFKKEQLETEFLSIISYFACLDANYYKFLINNRGWLNSNEDFNRKLSLVLKK